MVRTLFKLWYVRAHPHIGTKNYRTNWNEFRNLLFGAEPVEVFVEGLPSELQGPKRLLAVCRYLQDLPDNHGERFFLSWKDAARLLDCTENTAGDWFGWLIHRGWLEKLSWGSDRTRLAGTYRVKE
jgi:hypothetical protein